MIENLKLVGFRSFSELKLEFDKNINLVIGENGKGKTNILEAINLLCNNKDTNISMENIVNKNSNAFFISGNFDGNEISIAYDKVLKKKKISLNKKATTKQKIQEYNDKSVYFSPIEMNLFYLGPSLRRDFLDNLAANSFPNYTKILKTYEDILKNRNKILKNIFEEKSKKEELYFWDQKMIESAVLVYEYRIKIIDFFKQNTKFFSEYFFGKVENIEFLYKTKTDLDNIEGSIKKYLEANIDRDIILKKTQIGPHIDDFSIIIDGVEISDFASRGEIKSVILGLKLLELSFLEEKIAKKPILLIDDFLSELDLKHRDILLDKIMAYQSIISSIDDIEYLEGNKIFL